jgi:hypothetical protein
VLQGLAKSKIYDRIDLDTQTGATLQKALEKRRCQMPVPLTASYFLHASAAGTAEFAG